MPDKLAHPPRPAITQGLDLEPITAAGRIVQLEHSLAHEKVARAQAETLLEVKSRALTMNTADLVAGKAALQRNLARRTRQLLEAQRVAGIGTLLWDVGNANLEMSPQVHAMFALQPDAVVRSYRPLLRRVIKEDRRKFLHWMHSEVLRTLSRPHCAGCDSDTPRHERPTPAALPCRSDDFTIDLRCHSAGDDDACCWLRVIAQIEYDDTCQAAFLVATVQDVTRQIRADEEASTLRESEQRRLADLEQLNHELVAAREAALRANAAKSRFLAMMSHDIRTPLNGVIGMLALLDETGLDSRQQSMLDLVRSSGDQLRVLLNDIIDLARAEAGKLQLNSGPTNPTEVLSQCTEFWASLAAEKDLALDLVIPLNLPAWIEIDRVRLRQLLDNFLSNGIKYTNGGGIRVRGEYLPDARLRVEVADTGIRIPPERRAELFEDFGQLHLIGSEPGGAGLGLAICRRITEAMGGTIGVYDTGGGSCFWFEIPCRPTTAPQTVARQATLSLRDASGRPPQILVAEDIATNRIVIEGYLRKLGCDVMLVANGQLAVEAMEREKFDLVLMDMAMPVMDGAEATRRIRELENGRGAIPIIALTAYARPEELAPMMLVGANCSVAKPIVLQDLYTAMARELGV